MKDFLGLQGMHGHYASSAAQNSADLILGVGVRFSDRATGDKKKYAKKANIIHIDVDRSEIDKIIPASVGIAGDLWTPSAASPQNRKRQATPSG